MSSPIYTLLSKILLKIPFRIPRVNISKWLLLNYEITPADANIEEDLNVRLATEDDLTFLESVYNKQEAGSHVLAQDLMFWNKLGFRSLYVGCEGNEETPAVICYFMGASEKNLLNNMQDADMYSHIDKTTSQIEGIWAAPNKRGRNLAYRFGRILHSRAFYDGITSILLHIPVDATKIANFKSTEKQGYRPVGWIFLVKIDLPFFRSLKNVFIRKKFKDSDWSKFPLSLYRHR